MALSRKSTSGIDPEISLDELYIHTQELTRQLTGNKQTPTASGASVNDGIINLAIVGNEGDDDAKSKAKRRTSLLRGPNLWRNFQLREQSFDDRFVHHIDPHAVFSVELGRLSAREFDQ